MKHKPKEKICNNPDCNNKFMTNAPSHKFCNDKCRIIINNKRRDKYIGLDINKTIYYRRKCLRCDRKFRTKNKYIRLCKKCHHVFKSKSILSEDDF